MYRGIVSLVGGLVLLPLLGVTLPACGSKGPRVVEYRPGTFYFDWDERDEINSSQRLAVQRKFQARVRELNTELRRPVYVEALQASNQSSRDLQLSEILARAPPGSWRRRATTSSPSRPTGAATRPCASSRRGLSALPRSSSPTSAA